MALCGTWVCVTVSGRTERGLIFRYSGLKDPLFRFSFCVGLGKGNCSSLRCSDDLKTLVCRQRDMTRGEFLPLCRLILTGY